VRRCKTRVSAQPRPDAEVGSCVSALRSVRHAAKSCLLTGCSRLTRAWPRGVRKSTLCSPTHAALTRAQRAERCCAAAPRSAVRGPCRQARPFARAIVACGLFPSMACSGSSRAYLVATKLLQPPVPRQGSQCTTWQDQRVGTAAVGCRSCVENQHVWTQMWRR